METVKLEPFAKDALYGQLDKQLSARGVDNWSHDEVRREADRTIYEPLAIVFLHATEAEENAYKAEEKQREEAERVRLRHLHDNSPRPLIDLYNSERWREGLDMAKDGKLIELTEAAYWHFLECVPPKKMEGAAYVCGEPYTHNSQGHGVYLCATKNYKGVYYAQYGTVQQFDRKELFRGEPFKFED